MTAVSANGCDRGLEVVLAVTCSVEELLTKDASVLCGAGQDLGGESADQTRLARR